MFQIDHHAYSNRLFSVHPGEKMAFALTTMIICLAFSSVPTSLAVTLLMAGAVVFYAGVPWRFYLKLMTVPASFLFIGVITVAVSISATPEGDLFGFTLGRSSVGVNHRDLIVAVQLFLKSLGAVSCLYFLALTTPVVEIISTLRKIRVPALFIELMSLIYRFVFVLAETADKIYTAQSSRLGYRTLRAGYLSLGQLMANLFTRSHHRSQMLFTTLSARCYTGEIRVLEAEYPVSVRNVIIIVILEILLVTLGLVVQGLGGVLVGGIYS